MVQKSKYSQIRVKSVEWHIRDPAECCADKPSSGFSEFAYAFCLALCLLCCSEVVVEYETDDSGGVQSEPFDDIRDFPDFTPTDNGLSFTTSSYGASIPIVFGSDKLTGNVFWASKIRTDFVDITDSRLFYNTVDFALGLCEGEINGVLRIWLGEKLIVNNTVEVDGSNQPVPGPDGFIFGATIDLTDPTSPLRNLDAAKRTTKISVFTGSETQLPEGVMVEAEGGPEEVPAYRGLAYILFENFVIAGGSIPNVFVEVTSNTTSQFPRLFAAHVDTVIVTPRNDMLVVDPSYDRVYQLGVTGGAAQVLWTVENNLFTEVSQQLIAGTGWIWEQTLLLPLTGNLFVNAFSGNAGISGILDPRVGAIMSQIGPGGNLTSHSLTAGFARLGYGSCVFVGPGTNGLPHDIVCGIGFQNQSVGFMQVDDEGQLEMISTLNNILEHDDNIGVPVVIAPAFALTHPTFADSAPTVGTHIYGVSWQDPDMDAFHFWRASVDTPTASIAAPVYTALGSISMSEFGGTGFSHTLRNLFLDPTDNCLVMLVVQGVGKGPWIAKWSPFTGLLVWCTAVNEFNNDAQARGGEQAMLGGQKYCWIDADQQLMSIDLVTGAPTVILASVGLQTLPNNNGGPQFYNSYENTIYYSSGVTGQRLVKIMIDRLTRSTVELSDIIRLLVRRVGLIDTDIDVEDLTALTLNGYTISQRMSLRIAFAELRQAFTYDVIESNGKVKYKTRGGSAVETIDHKWLADETQEGWLRIKQENDAARIRKINLTYRDIDREYDDNVQSVILSKHGNQKFDNDAAIDVNVPIVLTATEAKSLAEILLYSKLVGNTTYDGTLPPRYKNLDPADVINISTLDGVLPMRLREVAIGADDIVKFQASQEDPDIYNDQVALFGEVGRFEKSSFPSVPVRVDAVVISIPFRSEIEAELTSSKYLLYYAFLPSRPTAILKRNVTMIINATEIHALVPPLNYPTWGIVIQPPNDTTSIFMTDTTSVLRVKVLSTSGADIATAAGGTADLIANNQCNLCYIGGELLQFVTATNLGNSIWEFTTLHRAKFGTDPFVGSYGIGAKFVLLAGNDGVLDQQGIGVQQVDFGTSPRKIVQFFMNTGNPFQPAPLAAYTAMNMRPWVPGDITMVYNGNDAEFTWQRRTRFGGSDWPDDGEDVVPLNEATEEYELYLYDDPALFIPFDETTYLRKVTVTTNAFVYTAAMQTEDGFVNTTTPLYMLVYQTGSLSGQDLGAGNVRLLEHK